MKLLKLVSCCLLSLPAWLAPACAAAQGYPDRPVRLVVPFPAGGGADAIARSVTPKAAQLLGQQIVILNKPGAGGNLGAAEVAKSPADGYTLLYGHNGTHGTNHGLYAKPGFDPLRDFVPVARLSGVPFMLAVNAQVPASNLRELLAWLRANPGKVSFASAGNGLTSHLAGVMLKNAVNSDMTHVAYKGAAAALTGLIAGETHLMIDTMINLMPHVRSGRLKAIAVMSGARVPMAREVPTIGELGMPELEIEGWDGIFAPAGTPPDVVRKLNAAFRGALEDKATAEAMVARGLFPVPGSPEDFGRHVARELPLWIKRVKDSGATVE